MDELDIFEYLRNNLRIELENISESSTCGGEVSGRLGVRVRLLLCGTCDNVVVIDDDSVYFD